MSVHGRKHVAGRVLAGLSNLRGQLLEIVPPVRRRPYGKRKIPSLHIGIHHVRDVLSRPDGILGRQAPRSIPAILKRFHSAALFHLPFLGPAPLFVLPTGRAKPSPVRGSPNGSRSLAHVLHV